MFYSATQSAAEKLTEKAGNNALRLWDHVIIKWSKSSAVSHKETRKMQKASAKKQLKPNKPRKLNPKTQSWRKKVDWAAAGRKAYETRMKNLKKNRKADNIKSAREKAEAPQQKIRK